MDYTYQNQHYGFDGRYNETALQPQYETLTHPDGTYYIAWKSVKKGTTEQVIAIAGNEDTDTTQTTYTFKTAEGLPVASTAENDNEMVTERSRSNSYKLTMPASNTPGETHINAYKTIPARDSTQSPTEQLAGRLNIAIYEGQAFTLELVPMGDATAAPTQIQTALNDIYRQAAITWQVSAYEGTFNPADWDEDEDGLVKSETSQFLSNYTKEMNNIISAFKTQANPDRETFYLFLVPGFSNDLAGFMPLGRNFGFIDANNTDIANTIGHELGHVKMKLCFYKRSAVKTLAELIPRAKRIGRAFVLYHPFSEKSPYYRPEGSTDNLMDYSDGTFLNKYQWDLIHDPRRIVRVAQDEGEGALTGIAIDENYTILFNHIYNNHVKFGIDNYLSKIEDETNKETKSFELEFTDDEKTKLTDEQKKWLKQWEIRNKNKENIFTDIFQSIRETPKGKKIPKIIAQPKKIYLRDVEIDGEKTFVAVYGQGKETAMKNKFTKVQVSNIDELTDIVNAKHIYCDETFNNYLVIGLYEEDSDKPSLIMQVIGADIFGITKRKWLKYLRVLREPIDGKTLEEIFDEYEVLTPDEISQVRKEIEKLEDKDKKGEHYLTLQEKVPYHNQRNNDQIQDVSDRMCNLTSEAACFEYLGISCPENDMQFEDYLEQLREDNEYGVRTSVGARDSLAKHLGASYTKIDYYAKVSAKKEDIKSDLLPKLKEGCAVMISVWPGCKGHLVRLQSITGDGLIVDDPYGKVTDFDTREACNSGGYDANSKTEENSKGNDNLWKWDDIKNITIKYAEIYSK